MCPGEEPKDAVRKRKVVSGGVVVEGKAWFSGGGTGDGVISG